jgi:hypothetical protein
MKAARSSKTSVTIYQNARRHNPEDCNFMYVCVYVRTHEDDVAWEVDKGSE